MPDIPEGAVQEAVRAHECAWTAGASREDLVRATLQAALPAVVAVARADERRIIAEGFRSLAAKCRAIPDKGLNMGQIWQRDEQAREYDRIASMIESPAREAGEARG